jgi:hypothetical protein
MQVRLSAKNCHDDHQLTMWITNNKPLGLAIDSKKRRPTLVRAWLGLGREKDFFFDFDRKHAGSRFCDKPNESEQATNA